MCEKRDCHYRPLREKCPNTEFLLVRIFPNSNWIRRETSYAGKYGPEKSPYLDTFHVVGVWISKADNSYGVLLFYKIKRPETQNLNISCCGKLLILTWKYALLNIFPVFSGTGGWIATSCLY